MSEINKQLRDVNIRNFIDEYRRIKEHNKGDYEEIHAASDVLLEAIAIQAGYEDIVAEINQDIRYYS